MRILTVPKKILADNSVVKGIVADRLDLMRAPQGRVLPSIMLMHISGGQEYSHQGPVGLWDGITRVYSRGKTDIETATLGSAVVKAMESWTGALLGYDIQLIQHLNTNADYTDDLSIFRQIDDFRIYYSDV